MTPKAIGGSQSRFVGQAAWSAKLAQRALAGAGHPKVEVQAAITFWGPGAPEIEGGHITFQNTLVLEGRKDSEWRKALRERPPMLDRETVSVIAGDLRRHKRREAQRCRG